MSNPILDPWVVYRLVPNFQRILIARFRSRNEAEIYLRVIRQIQPAGHFAIVFEPNAAPSPPNSPPQHYTIRHALTGQPTAVRHVIHQLNNLGYAAAGDWSPFQPMGNRIEGVSLLIQTLHLQ